MLIEPEVLSFMVAVICVCGSVVTATMLITSLRWKDVSPDNQVGIAVFFGIVSVALLIGAIVFAGIGVNAAWQRAFPAPPKQTDK